MRLVLDTNVVASALLWAGTPRVLLEDAEEERISLFTSVILLSELTDVLGRVKFAKRIATTRMSIDQLVDGYAGLTTLVRPIAISPTILDDPDDDNVLACAISARAEMIVSGDRHLVSLETHKGIRIVKAAEAVAVIGAA